MGQRRRHGFRPLIEDLEGRQLLSTVNPVRPDLPPGVSLATSQQKNSRIENLPVFLHMLDPSRPLPKELTARIQADLTELKGKLHQPPRVFAQGFEQLLRGMISRGSVHALDAAKLNRGFGVVLLQAGASPETTASLQASLDELAHIDINQGQKPPSLLANDYSLILQTALAVGRPLRSPTVPRLAPADDSEPKGDWATVVRQPHLVGTYDPGTTVTVYNDQGQALGSAKVAPSSYYTIAVDQPLPEGRNILHVQAHDDEGALSLVSRDFPITILSTTPRGPLALKAARGN